MPIEEQYQQLLDLSQRMLAAGMAQQWDELISLEEQRRALFDQMPAVGPADLSQSMVELIREIQSCDAELSDKVESWMADARILLRLDKSSAPKH